MSDSEQSSQLSALYDGQLPSEQADWVIRRALKDRALRQQWGRYALISAALRAEPLAVQGRVAHDVAARVRARLAIEGERPELQTVPTTPAVNQPRRQFVRGVWGTAIAAGVAGLALMVVRMNSETGTPLSAAADASGTGPAVASVLADIPVGINAAANSVVASQRAATAQVEPAAPAYSTPEVAAGRRLAASAPLVNYVVAHSDVAMSAVRFSPLSAAISDGYDPALGAVEMTEAEIGAHR